MSEVWRMASPSLVLPTPALVRCAFNTDGEHGYVQVATAAKMDQHPICFRFPRGNGIGVDLTAAGIKDFKGTPIEVCLHMY